MADPSSAQKRLAEQAERVVQAREEELAAFREKAAAYEKYLEEQLQKDRAMASLIKDDIVARARMAPSPPVSGPLTPQTEDVVLSKRISLTDQIRAVAKEILAERGGTMSRADIKSAIEERGLVINSPDPAGLLRAALNRSGDFEHIKNVGYRLTAN
ncbi:hypothetical protein [Rhizobium sp. PP-CC-3G-465]|uniref:hypothetical protein n=1 Tax=Rhizobium sp. PP-CC-3G-465 TaxID=2135648 RepID=UPI001047F7BE|nr:hypothetical protein C8J33_10333 [Rhizobium sp. PP-CC-3G-465]